jgi:TonB family protein
VNMVEQLPKTAPAPRPKPSALQRLAARHSGTVLSLLVHGAFVLAGILSVAAPRMGRGGGTVGTANPGSGLREYSATLQPDSAVDGSKSPDARVYSPAEPEPEPLDAVPPPDPEDFLLEPAETGIPAPKPAPVSETAAHARSKEAYTKLPPSSEPVEGPPGDGGTQKGNAPVNGAGGDTGGAGDGTIGAIFMPSPEYPFSARRKGIEGTVVVEIEVYPDGHCEHPKIASTSGCEVLDDAAMAVVKKWRYEPRSGESMELRRVRFVFKLNK